MIYLVDRPHRHGREARGHLRETLAPCLLAHCYMIVWLILSAGILYSRTGCEPRGHLRETLLVPLPAGTLPWLFGFVHVWLTLSAGMHTLGLDIYSRTEVC